MMTNVEYTDGKAIVAFDNARADYSPRSTTGKDSTFRTDTWDDVNKEQKSYVKQGRINHPPHFCSYFKYYRGKTKISQS